MQQDVLFLLNMVIGLEPKTPIMTLLFKVRCNIELQKEKMMR